MNIYNDYDNDGNNIVPCPICLSAHCPSKEKGKCPDEDMFSIEGEIRYLLDEYKETGDNSRIVNVLEQVESYAQQQVQEAVDIKTSSMTSEEENYWRGYIDAKVEDLGKSRTHRVTPQMQIEYRDKLLAKYCLVDSK